MSAEEHNALLAVPMAADVESCSDESAIHCAPPGEVGASQCETSFPSSPGSPKYPPPYFFLYALQFSLGIPAVILAIVQSVNWYAGLELYLLNCMVDSVIIAEVGIKLLVMGDDFWTTAWNVLDLFVAFLCAMSLPAMFLSRGGTIFAATVGIIILIRTSLRILRLLPEIVGALRNMLAGSAVGAFDRPLRDLLNQACYPGAYALLYLAMASLSTAAFGMGVSWWWQDLAFNIVGIIVNSLVLCEVGLRLLVLRTRFSHSVWNCLDVSICVFSIVGVSRCFQSPIEMDIACFFILLRSALQLVRISVLMRRRHRPLDAEEMSIEYVEAHDSHWSRGPRVNLTESWENLRARLAGIRNLFSAPSNRHYSPIRLEGDRPLDPDAEVTLFDARKSGQSDVSEEKGRLLSDGAQTSELDIEAAMN